jgi:S-adenosylmethionine decarboxylase
LTSIGKHYIVEIHGCDPEKLNSESTIQEIMVGAAKAANATILHSWFHKFSPQGVSGVVVISESHLTIHTWPEFGYAAADVYTCGEDIYPEKAVAYLQDKLKSDLMHIIHMTREAGMSPEIVPTIEFDWRKTLEE